MVSRWAGLWSASGSSRTRRAVPRKPLREGETGGGAAAGWPAPSPPKRPARPRCLSPTWLRGPGRGGRVCLPSGCWFTLFRFYGPQPALFDKSWRMGTSRGFRATHSTEPPLPFEAGPTPTAADRIPPAHMRPARIRTQASRGCRCCFGNPMPTARSSRRFLRSHRCRCRAPRTE